LTENCAVEKDTQEIVWFHKNGENKKKKSPSQTRGERKKNESPVAEKK